MTQPVWNTAAGSLGTYTSSLPVVIQLSATAMAPGVTVTYKLLSGKLPAGLTLSTTGLIKGSPELVSTATTSAFTIRATDNLNYIKDRTFELVVTGNAAPDLTTPNGLLFNTLDSVWIDYDLSYTNPKEDNAVLFELAEGLLPPGLELSESGNIRGYPTKPVVNITLESVVAIATKTTAEDSIISVVSTDGFTVNRPITFSGTVFGGLESNKLYYILSIVSTSQITVAVTEGGDPFPVTDDSGIMTATLLPIAIGQPVIRTYNFTVKLLSMLGSDTGSFSITVINQNAPVSQGGPGNPPNTRVPVILNTRPLTFNINDDDPYFGYYILPPQAPTTPSFLGTYQSGNKFAFKVIGKDFDGNSIKYAFNNLPAGLTGDINTGWITGAPSRALNSITNYNFSVAAYKQSGATIFTSEYFTFSMNISNGVNEEVVWISPSDLGTVYNGTTSTFSVNAESTVLLNYHLVSGQLPPNLTLLSNGQLVGKIAEQANTTFMNKGDELTFTFSIEAYSPSYSVIKSTKTFTLTVLQEFTESTDTLYITATPSLSDRAILSSLLENEAIIPSEALYRPDDINFGKSSKVVYEHAFGVYSSSVSKYIEAVLKNHYWRNIVLGEIKTAVARNEAGEIIYEVVYSEVIDDLVNPSGESVPEKIVWPRPVNLSIGPWFTSLNTAFDSYEEVLNQAYYTSLSPGYVRTLYPNSLDDMRTRVFQELGQVNDYRLLPTWMTSQQRNGSTTGYVQAWVICYTKPGSSETIQSNIQNLWPFTLNQINFKIDRFTVDKSTTYNYNTNIIPPVWSELPSADPTPDPIDSKNFYVLFPRKTILPDKSQY